jgi:peptidoglycan/LPS O-acetylase OafA/YrhL
MVVLLHTAPFFGIERPRESYLAVDLFFALSGVVICHTYESRLLGALTTAQFVWIRAVRLYPLYVAGTSLSVIALFIFGAEPGSPALDVLLPLSLVVLPYLGASAVAYFPLNIPAWSLILEFMVNLLYARIIRRLDRRALLLIMLFSILGLLLCVRLIRPHSVEFGWRHSLWRGLDLGMIGGVFRVGFSFFAGVLVYRQFVRRRPAVVQGRLAPWVPWLIVVVVALILSAAPSRELRPYFEVTVVAAIFPLLIYAALWFQSAGLGDPLFKIAGNLSYAIYAIHYPLSILIDKTVARCTGMHLESYAPWGGLGFLAVLLLVCSLLDRLYDIPLRGALLKSRLRPLPS